jgi:hypothetical protein
MCPPVGLITAPKAVSNVLSPDPDGPIKPTTSPGDLHVDVC